MRKNGCRIRSDPKKVAFLEELECENQGLLDELSSVAEESDVGRTVRVLRALSGVEQQHISGFGKLKSECN